MELAKEFNLAATSISNWVRAAEKREAAENRSRDNAAVSGQESDKAKIKRLERELASKEEELEILGKALAFFARRTDL
jgi:transposase